MRAQCGRQSTGVLTLTLEAETEAADAAKQHPRLERAEDSPRQQPLVVHCRQQLRLAAGHVARDEVTVSGKRLGGAGHHEIGAERQRLLPQRCRGGVVDDEVRSPAVADPGQPVQVDHLECRIGRGLGQHDVRIGRRLIHLRHRRLPDDDALRRQQLAGPTAHLVVAVGGHHQHRTGPHQHPQRTGYRGHPGGEGVRRRRTLECGEGGLQLFPVRVGVTPVDVRLGALLRREVIRRRRNRCRRHRGPGNRRGVDGAHRPGGIAVGLIPRFSHCHRLYHSDFVRRPRSRATASSTDSPRWHT